MKWWLGLWLLPLLALAACDKPVSFPRPDPAHALRSNSATGRDFSTDWSGPDTFTVAEGVHVLGRLFPSAAFAIETSEGVILIDSGVDENGGMIREGFLESGLQVDDIRYILLTHAHYDHVFGANKLRSISGAIVAAGRDDCETLRAGDQDAMFSLFPRVAYSGDPIQVDRELDDGDVIEVGDVTIEVIGAPGHTPGSVCYLLRKGGQRILFSGDVIASLNFGPATYPVYIAPSYRGDAEQYLQTIERLLAMEPPDLLLTGHPRQQQAVHSIKLAADQWQRLLQPAKVELEQVVARYQTDGRDFLDTHPKQIEAGVWYLGMLDGIGVYGLESNDQFVVVNAPGNDQFAEFLSKRLQLLDFPSKHPTAVLVTGSQERAWSGVHSLSSIQTIVAAESMWPLLKTAGIGLTPQSKAAPPIETIPLGLANAYSIVVKGKRVLFTPDVPRNVSLFWKDRLTGAIQSGGIEPYVSQLRNELDSSSAVADAYRVALETLSKITPDIWLPATPMVGQNANLYDDQWRMIIDENLRQTRQ